MSHNGAISVTQNYCENSYSGRKMMIFLPLKTDVQIKNTKSINFTSNHKLITPMMVVEIGLRYMGGKQSNKLVGVYRTSIA